MQAKKNDQHILFNNKNNDKSDSYDKTYKTIICL